MIDHEDIQEALSSQGGAGWWSWGCFFFFFLKVLFFYLAPSLIFLIHVTRNKEKTHCGLRYKQRTPDFRVTLNVAYFTVEEKKLIFAGELSLKDEESFKQEIFFYLLSHNLNHSFFPLFFMTQTWQATSIWYKLNHRFSLPYLSFVSWALRLRLRQSLFFFEFISGRLIFSSLWTTTLMTDKKLRNWSSNGIRTSSFAPKNALSAKQYGCHPQSLNPVKFTSHCGNSFILLFPYYFFNSWKFHPIGKLLFTWMWSK